MSSKRKSTIRCLGIYTFLFIIIAAVIVAFFYLRGYSFIRLMDSVAQHFPSLCYTREYLRGLFSGGSLSFPMVDFSIGQGFDIIGTLNYYGFGDPLNLFTVFFPDNHLELMYVFMIFLHTYLAGIAFYAYCRQIKQENSIYLVIGALLYAFCSFMLYGGVKHPLFLNGLLYLPLLLIGVERILQKKGIIFLAIAVGFSFMSNYYFMYMSTILAAIYFFIRLGGRYKELGVKGLLELIFKIILAYIWGICLAGIIFFPAVYSFLNNPREPGSAKIELFYSNRYYSDFFKKFFFANETSRWSLPGIGILGAVSAVILGVRHTKKERQLMVGFVILTLMLCVPFVGSIMNGFSYVSNRWTYGFSFLFALIAVFELPQIVKLSVRQLIGVAVVTLGVLGIGLLPGFSKIDLKQTMWVGIVLLLFLLYRICHKYMNRRISELVITILAVFTIILNANFLYAENYANWTTDFLKRGGTTARHENSALKALELVEDDTSFYRVENHWDNVNYTLLTGDHVTNFYYSIIPSSISKLYQSTWLGPNDRLPVLASLDSRTVLTSIASTKYYTSKEDDSAPYGYEKKGTFINHDGTESYLYENSLALPLGYTYNKTISRETYEKLQPWEKEQVLLDYAVVDSKVGDLSVETAVKDYGATLKDFTVKEEKMRKRVQEKNIYGKKKTKITFTFDGDPDCETYLYIKDLKVYTRMKLLIKGDNGFNSILKGPNEERNAYSKREGVLVNLGYSKEGLKSCTLTFGRRSGFEYGDMKILCVPMGKISETIEQRKAESLENVVVSTNKVSGNISVSENKILQLSIPYSKGWSAYVDGKKVSTFSSAIAYTGIYLEKGDHEVVLKYVSPGIIPGFICTMIGILFIVITVIKKRRRNTNA